jgi:hypothetical protein
MEFDTHKTVLNHFHYDVFEIPDAQTIVPIAGRVTFITNGAGVVDRVALPIEPALSDRIFTRVSPTKAAGN